MAAFKKLHHEGFMNDESGLFAFVEEDLEATHSEPRYRIVLYEKDQFGEYFEYEGKKFVSGVEAFREALKMAGLDLSKVDAEYEESLQHARALRPLPENYEPRSKK